MKMISIFGEDLLWQKITTIADVQITKNDTLPQQVCVDCAKTAVSAYLFKKKCEDADRFYRQQLLLKKIHGLEKQETGGETRKDAASGDRAKSRGCSTASSSGTASGSTTGSGSSSSSTSSDDDEEEDNDNANANANPNPNPNPNGNDNDNGSVAGDAGSRLQNGHGDAINGHLVEDPNDEDVEQGELQLVLDDRQRSLFDDEQQDQSGIELSNGVALADGEEGFEVMTP
ncbi:GL13351 [Drosophila persimilis]|uniref:GL13351 n=1 Tax=Drosophila persimilis TaxID=7234 RepID=B4H323_DROPE|nr:GL13351 [Drosophila persimilis]